MTKQVSLDRLAQLSDADLAAVVLTVERAVMWGDGWLQRTADGSLRCRESLNVVIIKEVGEDA